MKRKLCFFMLTSILFLWFCTPALAVADLPPDTPLSDDTPLTGGQLAYIVSSYLQTQDAPDPAVDFTAWYAAYAKDMTALGVFPTDGTFSMDTEVTRSQAFYVLAHAFQLETAQQDLSALAPLTDMADTTPATQRAAVALLQAGALSATESQLSPNAPMLYAPFMDMLQRLTTLQGTADALPASSANMVTLTEDTVFLRNATLPYSLMLAPSVRDVQLQNTTIEGTLLVRGASIAQLSLFNTTGQRLTLATAGTDLSVSAAEDTHFSTVTIGDGNGVVALSGSLCDAVEITGNNRTVSLSNMNLSCLCISGSHCTIQISADTTIGTLINVAAGSGNVITVDGTIASVDLQAPQTTLNGTGYAEAVQYSAADCSVTLPAGTVIDTRDSGLSGILMDIAAPTVPAGGELTATATFSNVASEKVCSAQWYLDGNPVSGFANSSFSLAENTVSVFSQELVFSYRMQQKHTVGLCVLYQNAATGLTEKLFAQSAVLVENYPDDYYAEPVLSLITPTYSAGNTDYSDVQKETFVNAKNYSSDTDFLIWVSLSAQKVNVFKGSQNKWSLLHSFDCASGKSSTPTPLGITHVTYKQTAWITEDYQCRPIVRFYPGTGYAFHSRLYSPSGKVLIDDTIGRPASHGCIRMMDEGIYWLYDNIPTDTTVVIY